MKHFPSYFALLALIALGPFARGAEPDSEKTFVDPENVDDPDFAVQGEYAGALDGEKWGVQVIANGGGKFDFVAYPGGLPGDGWDGDKSNRKKGTAERTESGVRLTSSNDGDAHYALIEDGTLKVINKADDSEAGSLKRVQRKSETLGKQPPKDAVVLFDGSNTDAWKDGKRTDDGLLMQGATSKQRFQDFSLHMEFRTPYKPSARGQARGNSGFYAQGRYEVQILDSFGLEGRDNECGGIYSVGEPKINMCFPPLTWQTYDVDFKAARYDSQGKKTANARLTVRHNGVLIHEDIEADHATTASPLKEGPEPGPIFFQDHGNPVRFRNVWLIEKQS